MFKLNPALDNEVAKFFDMVEAAEGSKSYYLDNLDMYLHILDNEEAKEAGGADKYAQYQGNEDAQEFMQNVLEQALEDWEEQAFKDFPKR